MGAQATVVDTLHIFIAIVAHKGLAAYALGSSIVDSGASKIRFWVVIAIFALATPAGIGLGSIVAKFSASGPAAALSALASGKPHSFHIRVVSPQYGLELDGSIFSIHHIDCWIFQSYSCITVSMGQNELMLQHDWSWMCRDIPLCSIYGGHTQGDGIVRVWICQIGNVVPWVWPHVIARDLGLRVTSWCRTRPIYGLLFLNKLQLGSTYETKDMSHSCDLTTLLLTTRGTKSQIMWQNHGWALLTVSESSMVTPIKIIAIKKW